MAKFVTIGERLSTTAPAVNKAFTERDPEPILKRAKQQLDAGATYLDVNIGPAENDGPELMKWAVELLQSNFDNVPLALDTSNVAAIEAGISVYNRAKGKLMERGMEHGMDVAEDMWFDPLFLVIKGMQDKQMQVLEFIKMISDMGMKSTGGLSNNSNGMPKHIRPIMDSAMVAMAMMNGLTSAIVNPNDLRLMETIKSCDIIKNNNLYADSYLEI